MPAVIPNSLNLAGNAVTKLISGRASLGLWRVVCGGEGGLCCGSHEPGGRRGPEGGAGDLVSMVHVGEAVVETVDMSTGTGDASGPFERIAAGPPGFTTWRHT